MEPYHYTLILYVFVFILSGVWAEYRYHKGVRDGNNLFMIKTDFKKEFSELMWQEQVHGSKQMLQLLIQKKIIKVDNETGIVYGIADSSYDAKNDLDKISTNLNAIQNKIKKIT